MIVTDYRLAELAAREWKVRARPERITPEAAAHLAATTPRSGPEARAAAAGAHASSPRCCPAGKTVVPAGQNVRMDVLFLERAYQAARSPGPSTTT